MRTPRPRMRGFVFLCAGWSRKLLAQRMSGPKRIPTDGEQNFGHNPFHSLTSEGLPPAPEGPPTDSGHRMEAKPARKNRGRVDIIRQTAGRGGKTVTVVKGF